MDRQIDAIPDHFDSIVNAACSVESKITAGQRASYERDGFLVLEQVIDSAAIDDIRHAIATLIANDSLPGENLFDACIRLNREDDKALHNVYKVSHQTAAMNRLRERCRELVTSLIPQDSGVLIDVDSHIIFCIPDSTRLTWGWHQESTYDVFDGKGINFCLPIFERATRENGSMSVLSGSHTKGKLPFIKMKNHENGATTLVPQGIEALEREFTEVLFEADPGDLVMFDRHLIHRSNSNRSPRPRVTAVIRFMQIETLPASFDKPY
ncbi:Phytanoyl-CoA dioxygenase (PhyH) [Novipirellula galeiformis]|uniref:Phytanoyl-CoA dioxygenase (PhyH) n=1 Tax=Novipirellula galeiformis TaxID=2528004 RepID=A0A5C6CJ04_9BACT|nr:phytanoyl-CoA dioxygenase family protein [Novipirellula galeiformis]TWU24115.1 Phytanoyl-CoA dioxygenase (PhyH) [Novipirellula galeiformis]